MENLAQAIQRLRNGTLSREDFFAQLDRMLVAEPVDVAALVHTLATENAARPLPRDLYAQAQQRITRKAAVSRADAEEETRVLTRRTTDRAAAPPPSPEGGAAEHPDEEGERIKGVGDTLNGRFVLEHCIGFGGMGTVYKALDLRKLEASDRMPYIAIKVLNVQFRGHPKSLIALQREARKAQVLAHPNIVSVYDFDRDGQMVYLTMEYLSGKPLSHLLRASGFKGLPYAEAMHIVKGMGTALAYAHEQGFVHCDFKPANVILTDAGVVKVIDFGIARVFQKAEVDADATVFDPGSLGALTPAYASLEMLEHRAPDPRDDIYGLACITYELLTGRHPYDRLPASQVHGTTVKVPPPANLNGKQWRALKAALSIEREARTPSVALFLKQLGGEAKAPAGPVRKRVRWPILAGGALAVAATGLGLTWYFAPDLLPAVPSLQGGKAAPPLAPDKVSAILAGLPCSALIPTVQDHALSLRGYVAKSVGVAGLGQRLAPLEGMHNLNLDVQEVEADKCAVINLFGPYWIRSQSAGKAVSLRTNKTNGVLTEGDPLMVDITSPGFDSFLSVDYYVLDGSVAHLLPNQGARDNAAPPNYTATIGGLGNWVIAKPFGTELVVLVATPVPLFEGVRPDVEPAQAYLRAVAARLAAIGASQGVGKIAVDMAQIKTRPRAP
jgi:serine/threonine protein kinase